MFIAAKTRENTASVTMEHKFLRGHQGDLCVKECRRDSSLPAQGKRKMDTRGTRRETTKECRRWNRHTQSGQLISRIVSREK